MRLFFSPVPLVLLLAAVCPSLRAASEPKPGEEPAHPPIPVRFTLAEPGFVTLVIEDAGGMRVRNLVSETPFPKGENVVWWDGLDDLGRDTDAAKHAVYHIPGKLVAAGAYRVRGLVRPEVNLRYEMTAYHPGNPPWLTKDRSSGWLANHTPPSAVLFVPPGAAPEREGHPAPGGQILVGSFVSEGGSGLAWLDTDGHKLHGQEWVGGVWTGATQLCRDEGDRPVPGVYAYTGSAWRGDKYNGFQPELRLHMLVNAAGPEQPAKLKAPGDARMGTGEDPPVLKPTYKLPAGLEDPEHSSVPVLGGLAARNGILVAAVTPLNQLVFIDVAAHRTVATADARPAARLGVRQAGAAAWRVRKARRPPDDAATRRGRQLAPSTDRLRHHPAGLARGAAGVGRDGAGRPAATRAGPRREPLRQRPRREQPGKSLLAGRQAAAHDRHARQSDRSARTTPPTCKTPTA